MFRKECFFQLQPIEGTQKGSFHIISINDSCRKMHLYVLQKRIEEILLGFESIFRKNSQRDPKVYNSEK